ncbi:hypothetical protein BJX66DRAFT_341103 [Aspergillus keveii]|uniref:Arrestin-like N-terminal domain-containing protein n=1 Tax=Aspergillus keveii TaxID=714993 RepID=A0ABR4FXA3_9EURO
MPLRYQTLISGVTTEVGPGGLVEGAVEIHATEPLTFCELNIALIGRATSRIVRELIIPCLPGQARWKGKVTVCERVLVLVDQHTSLEPGSHQFPFRLRVPETTELRTVAHSNGRQKEKWKQIAPFTDGQTGHPLPPSVEVRSDQGNLLFYGDASAEVEYELQVTRKMNPREWKTPPAFVQKMNMAAPLAMHAHEVKWVKLENPLDGGYRDVILSVRYPTPIPQWEGLPIQVAMLNSEGFALVSLKVKVITQYVVRGRSWILPENSSPIVSKDKLIAWHGRIDLAPGQYQVVQSQPLLASQVVAMFSTINVACVGHELQIKYKVEDSKGMVISGTLNRVVVDIRGANRVVDRGSESPRASMGAAEYQVWATGRYG